MFNLFKKQPEEAPAGFMWDKEEAVKTATLWLALQDILDKFNVKLDTIEKENIVIYDNRPPRMSKATLETLDNHTITLELYLGNNFMEHSKEISITVDNYEAIDMHYTKVASYLSSCGVMEKQSQLDDYVLLKGYVINNKHIREFINTFIF